MGEKEVNVIPISFIKSPKNITGISLYTLSEAILSLVCFAFEVIGTDFDAYVGKITQLNQLSSSCPNSFVLHSVGYKNNLHHSREYFWIKKE